MIRLCAQTSDHPNGQVKVLVIGTRLMLAISALWWCLGCSRESWAGWRIARECTSCMEFAWRCIRIAAVTTASSASRWGGSLP